MLPYYAAHITLGLYAGLLAAGGIMGFVKARSRPSLIAGLISAAAALIALGLSAMKVAMGIPLGILLAVLLFLFFGHRFAKRNRQFMPNGLMAVVSLFVLGILIAVRLDNDRPMP